MALEHKIDELTAAVGELTKAIKEQGISIPAPEKKSHKKVASKKTEEVKEQENVVETQPENQAKPPAASATATLDDVKTAATKLAASVENGREVLLAVLQEFDASKVSEVKEEDYARIIEVMAEGTKS